MLSRLARLIAPPLCVGCNREGIELCAECVQKIEEPLPRCTYCKKHNKKLVCDECKLATNVDDILVAGLYSGVLRNLISTIKFHNQKSAVSAAANVIADEFLRTGINIDVIVPIPTSPSRVRQRGFDHTRELAKRMSKLLNIETSRVLYRRKFDRQVGQNREKRLSQAKNQFGVAKKIVGNVLLVDDVITTGATVASCASLLKGAGANKVYVAAIAQD